MPFDRLRTGFDRALLSMVEGLTTNGKYVAVTYANLKR